VIFFQIQAAYNINYVLDLVSFVFDPECFYYISVDRSHPEAARTLRRSLACSNIVVISKKHVTWGGRSQVDVMLDGMRAMLSKPQMQFYINISDSDIPLWTVSRLKEHLLVAFDGGTLAHMPYWAPAEFGVLSLDRTEGEGFQEILHRPDVKFQVDRSIAHYFMEPRLSPVVNANIRSLLVSNEDALTKTLFIQPMRPLQRVAREVFFKKNPIYIGRQWLIAHASLIRSALELDRFNAFYRICTDTFIPDEMFFQTLFLNCIQDTKQISPNNLRFMGGAPGVITDQIMEDALNSSAAFARKLVFGKVEKLISYARDLHREAIKTFSAYVVSKARQSSDLSVDCNNIAYQSEYCLSDQPQQNQDDQMFNVMPLTRLANDFGSDKGTANFFKHRYTFLYDLLFAPIRQLPIKMLEIGLAMGGPETVQGSADRQVDSPSVRMWLEYFPKAEIVGFDISDFSQIKHDRFTFIQGDLSNEGDYDKLVGLDSNFHIIIDDASHASPHQQMAFRHLFDAVVPGGLYIIEDLNWQSPVYESGLVPKTADFLISYFEKGEYLPNQILTSDFMTRVADQIEVFSYFPDFSGAASGPKLAVFRKRQQAQEKTFAPYSTVEAIDAGATETERRACHSFDLFDTLIGRRDVHHWEVFNRIESIAALPGFATARLAAEKECFDIGEYDLDSIYNGLARRLGLLPPAAAATMAVELEVEYSGFIPIKENCSLVTAGDLIVSDMYLPKEFLERVLTRVCQLKEYTLHVSSHGKRSGRVWDKLKTQYDIIAHIGDDATTDLASPIAAGIPAKLTSVAHRTDIEVMLADFRFEGLSNIVREARLTTWHDDSLIRRSQLAQIQINFPLLWVSSVALLRISQERKWDRVLFSGRDGYLWSRLYDEISRCVPETPPGRYFHSSRPARAHPSLDYIEYIDWMCGAGSSVIVDVCGTGWSLTRLIEQMNRRDIDIFLIHRLMAPSLQQAYEEVGKPSIEIPIFSIVHRAAESRDNDILEELNRAPFLLLENVEKKNSTFRPVFTGVAYRGVAREIFEAHQHAFSHTLQVFALSGDTISAEMMVAPFVEPFAELYKSALAVIDDLTPLLATKEEEESRIWESLHAGVGGGSGRHGP
jgi:hypothetical protein